MAQIVKSKNFLFYTFLIFQLLLNVTFTSCAVIRRRTHRDTSDESTGITTSHNAVDVVTIASIEDVGISSSLEDELDDEGTTIKNKLPAITISDDDGVRKETTTLKEVSVDENTVGFSSKAEENDHDKDDDNQSTTEKENDDTSTEEEVSMHTTIQPNDTGKPEIRSTTARESALIEDFITTDRNVFQTIIETEDKRVETTTVNEYSVREGTPTLTKRVFPLLEETTDMKVTTEESSTLNTTKIDETTSIKTLEGETTFKIQPEIDTSTGLVDETSTVKEEVEDKHITPFTTPSTEGSINGSHVEVTTIGTPSTAAPIIEQDQPEDAKSLTSTLKSDSTTSILTSTETSDESPIQTTFLADIFDHYLHAEIKNSTSSSAEKRGKFIDDNYNSANEFQLPNNSDAWALAAMKYAGKTKSSELQNSVETSDEKAINNSMVTKSILDWTRVMMNAEGIEPEATFKTPEDPDDTTTEASSPRTTTEASSPRTTTEASSPRTTTETSSPRPTTEARAIQNNEVLVLTTVRTAEEKTESPELRSSNRNDLETRTLPELIETTTDQEEKMTTPDRFTMDDTTLLQTDEIGATTVSLPNLFQSRNNAFIDDNQVEGDNFEGYTTTIKTTTTTTTPNPDIVPLKSEIPQEANTGTVQTSSQSLIDFTTPEPILTFTSTTTTTALPPISIFSWNDDRTTESPNTASTLPPPPPSSPSSSIRVEEAAATTETEGIEEDPSLLTTIITTTTSTTTTAPAPAVTITAATTEAPHTPALISNETMTQKPNNYYSYDDNVDDDDVLDEMTTISVADNSHTSSILTFEPSTRVASTRADTDTRQSSAAEVDESFDVTTTREFDVAFDRTTNIYTFTPATTTTTSTTTTQSPPVIIYEPTTEYIDFVQKHSDTGSETSIESNVIDPLHQPGATSTTTESATTPTTTTTSTPTPTTTESDQESMRMQPTAVNVEISTSTTTTTTTTTTTALPPVYYGDDDSTTTLQSISTKKEDIYSIVPTLHNDFHVPKLVETISTTTVPGELAAAGIGIGQPMDQPHEPHETDVNVIIAISVSVVGIVALILLVAFLYVMRKRQKQMSYGQRCRPVSLDAYSLDNVSVYNSVRRKGAALRASKRTYGNVAFDDPSLRHNVLSTHELAKFVEKKSSIWEEFRDVPQIIARADEVPPGCEDKNRYANVIPLPETRVILQRQNGEEKSEYINANYVRGPKDTTNYYIACQAPLETTVVDFWRMIWEQNSRVIIMATDLIENGIDKCAEYLPPSVTLDNHTVFGDFQVTLKNREVKEKYAISTLMVKNIVTGEIREIIHYWYQWPEAGVPTDEAAIIAMLLEARSSLKQSVIDQNGDVKLETIITDENHTSKIEINGNVTAEKSKLSIKDQGPLTIHCSPGTGRTGTIIACDIAMRCLEEPKRSVDIPQIVYSVRRGRASAVQTKEQYEFIYKVTHMYATKISNLNNDN